MPAESSENSTQPRNDSGRFIQVVDDDEVAACLRELDSAQTTRIALECGLPRTTAWDALKRLEAAGRVRRRHPPNGGTSAVWIAVPPAERLSAKEFLARRKQAGLDQQEALDAVADRLNGNSPSVPTLSRFENGQTELDSNVKNALADTYRVFIRENASKEGDL